MIKPLAIALAIAAVLPHASAADTATAQATVSNIRITLTDLDPNDGIAPTFTYQAGDYDLLLTHAVAFNDRVPTELNDWPGNSTPFSAQGAQVHFTDGVLDAQAHAAGSGTSLPSLNLEASASARDPGGYTFGFSQALWQAQHFILSPHTSLSILVDLSVNAALPDGDTDAWAFAAATVLVNDQWGSLMHEIGALPRQDLPSGQDAMKTFGFTIDSGAAGRSVAISFNTMAGTVTAVPEPASYALLLGGLGFIGAAARRRRVSHP